MAERLYVYYEDQEVGVLRPDEKKRLSFSYSHTWLSDSKINFPVSQSMPLREEAFTSMAHAYFTFHFEKQVTGKGVNDQGEPSYVWVPIYRTAR